MSPSPSAHPDDAALVWPGHLVHRVHSTATSLHASHSLRVCVALSGELFFGARAGRIDGTARAVVVAPHTRHWIGGDGLCVSLFVEPEREGRVWLARGGVTALDDVLAGELCCAVRDLDPGGGAAVGLDELTGWADETLARVARRVDLTREPLDRRIVAARRLLIDSPRHLVPADELARTVGLSTSRLSALLRGQLGWPLRRYARWQRLLAGIVAACDASRTLTDAAHIAGFADHAHFTRTAREMLGQPPGMVPAQVHVLSGYHD